MAAQKINYENKDYGMLWRPQEANQVKEVVNAHADDIDALASRLTSNENSYANTIKKTSQTLSGSERAQARENIGAASEENLEILASTVEAISINDGLLYFDGFVDNVTIVMMTLTTDDPLMVFFDTARKRFVAATQSSLLRRQYYESFSRINGISHTNYGDMQNAFKPWPMRIFKNRMDGESYMWNGSDLIPLSDVSLGGLIEFDGFVDDVTIDQISVITSGGVFFDITKKTFCVKNGTGYANNFEDMLDYQQEVWFINTTVKLWPLRIYKCKADGKPYMWDGDTLVCLMGGTSIVDPLEGMVFVSGYVPAISLKPDVFYRVTSGLIGGLTITSLLSGNTGELAEYMLEFKANGSDFTLTLPQDIRWMNGEEPVWEDGWTYQISIMNGLAIAAGWEAAQS